MTTIFPISYSILVIWLAILFLADFKTDTDNYIRLTISFFGLLVGINISYNDAWLTVTDNSVQTFVYQNATSIKTISTVITPAISIQSITNVFDFYFGLMIIGLALSVMILIVTNIFRNRK